jgi:predicted AlkP superfamily phosphohydrolase/phosphomutase
LNPPCPPQYNGKVLVVGLDGATLDLLEPWAQAGELPTFRRLMAEGAYGPLHSTIPPMTAPAWTSFMTGKNPGKHGLYDWIYRRSDSYQFSPVTAARCHEATLWSLLSAAGRRVCVVNVPMTYPPVPVNGSLISGMPAPSTRVLLTEPPDLLAEIEREVGEYFLYPDPGQAYSDQGVDVFLKNLYRTTETRLQVLDYLRAREAWDFCMVVLNGTDTVQHALWKYMSPDHPLYEAGKATKYGDAILRYFQYVDEALGRLVAGLDDCTTLVLMSDHGFGPFHKFIHLNNWLRAQGWLRIKDAPWARIKTSLFDLGLTPMGIYDLLMRLGLGALKREVVRGRGQGFLRGLFLSFDDVDWPRTKAYALGNVGQICLNVQGREPQGSVLPGAEYEATRQEIVARLGELRDPETGEPVVETVYHREEIYWGRYVEEAADVVFMPTRMEYFGFGEYEFGSNRIVQGMKRGISGTHRLNGMALLWGNGVQAPLSANSGGPSTNSGRVLQEAQIYDLAPTILQLMGEAVPQDMDGRVLTEALDPEYAVVPPVDRPLEEALSDADARLITERLRGLGYVG